MAKQTYITNYIFTTGTSGNTSITLPDHATPEQILLAIHVPSKTTLYSFNDSTFNNCVFNYIQKTVTATGTTTSGSTAITFTSGEFAKLNYATTGMQQGWRVSFASGTPSIGATVDYTDGTATVYMEMPATASGSQTITFTDQNYVTQITNIPVNTSTYSSTDKLLIITDSLAAPTVNFRDFLVDPVGKLRVSTPQSLIDTDFEYGPQATKWQTLALINNWFASYGKNTDSAISNVTNITGNGTSIATVTTGSAHGLVSGQPFQLIGTASSNANGDFIVGNVNSSTSFNFVGAGTVTSGSIFQNGIILYPGAFFTGAAIPLANVTTYGNTTAKVWTSWDHGLQVNNTISVIGTPTAALNGAWTIASVPEVNSFTYTMPSSVTAGTTTTGNVYVRPQGIAFAKPWDGGIMITTNDSQPNSRIIRQTRKYFRYQSGKGIQVSFAVAFNNPAQPSGNIYVRAGAFDDQNGAFWEWDGQVLWAVRRSSTRNPTGTLTVTNGSQAITGTSTLFTTELAAGQNVVIKGNSYKILRIISNTSMIVAPAYRADPSVTSLSGVNYTVTVDSKIPQSGFNMDKADGTGPTGFKIDINKLIMWYIDYAWYGAGTARFGVKDQNGEIIYLHRFVHGNNKTEAYFRSGNLPMRYEVANGNTAPVGQPTLFHWGSSMIMDGGFNTDRGYTFATTGGQKTFSTSNVPLMSIRLAPTVDTGIPGNYGVRDLTNHMQLWPTGCDVVASDSCAVQIILNGNLLVGTSPTWTNVGGASLTQYDLSATAISGGEVVSQYISPSPPPRQTYFATGTNFAVTTFNLGEIKELNNGMFGGFNTYPDGPDTLTVVVSPLNAGLSITAQAVLRWTENQS